MGCVAVVKSGQSDRDKMVDASGQNPFTMDCQRGNPDFKASVVFKTKPGVSDRVV